MSQRTLTRAEWAVVAHELGAPGREAAPPGLAERIAALLAEAPPDWPDQLYTLTLDDECVDAIDALLIELGDAGGAPSGGLGGALAEAETIVREHQRRRDEPDAAVW